MAVCIRTVSCWSRYVKQRLAQELMDRFCSNFHKTCILGQNLDIRKGVLKMSKIHFLFWQKNLNFSNVLAFIFQIGLLAPTRAIISKFEVQTKLTILT